MKDKETLQKAIGIAEDNDSNYECDGYDRLTALLPLSDEIDYRGIIFSHDFAKAFWDEEEHCLDRYDWCGVCEDTFSDNDACWQYHLQQMVLCSNPIQYLKQFVNTENSK